MLLFWGMYVCIFTTFCCSLYGSTCAPYQGVNRWGDAPRVGFGMKFVFQSENYKLQKVLSLVFIMPPKRRKHQRGLPRDILSNLPDRIIDVILMCLPCKDAVKTSILSKKWRYHWCRLTVFELYYNTYWGSHLLDRTVKITNIINQFLTHHEGHIAMFTLDIQYARNCPKIDDLIYFLSMNDIQDLVLRFPWSKVPYKVPFSLFTCSVLTNLSLQNCFIHPPSFFNGFDSLTSLELCKVEVCPELLGNLISECPLLEHLVLRVSEDFGIIKIDAPMLKSFVFNGRICCIRLEDVPLLSEISLVGNYAFGGPDDFDIAELFESCHALEHLDLSLEDVDEDPHSVPTRLPFDLNHVKHFHLVDMLLEENYKLACTICLIRSFPFLEYLEIDIEASEIRDHDALEWLRMEHFSGVTFNHLREVKIEYFGGTRPEMQLVELFLAKSPVLVRMVVDIGYLFNKPPVTRSRARARAARSKARRFRRYRYHKPTRQGVIADISKFQHASPKAKLVYIK